MQLPDVALYGFEASWLLPVFSYPEWLAARAAGKRPPQADHLAASCEELLPGANALLLLLRPYAPYRENSVSAYYPASQKAYLSMRALTEEIKRSGIGAATARVPLKEAARQAGIGRMLKNGLFCIPPFGTRFALQGILLVLPEPPERIACETHGNVCASCGRCIKACPAGAIDETGFHWERCLRTYMENEPMPREVMEKITSLLGCERCQACCPENAGIPAREMTEEESFAFDTTRLLQGGQKEALQLIGKNQKKNGKLIAQAAVQAANAGRYDLLPLIGALLENDPTPIVRSAAEYALSALKKA